MKKLRGRYVCAGVYKPAYIEDGKTLILVDYATFCVTNSKYIDSIAWVNLIYLKSVPMLCDLYVKHIGD